MVASFTFNIIFMGAYEIFLHVDQLAHFSCGSFGKFHVEACFILGCRQGQLDARRPISHSCYTSLKFAVWSHASLVQCNVNSLRASPHGHKKQAGMRTPALIVRWLALCHRNLSGDSRTQKVYILFFSHFRPQSHRPRDCAATPWQPAITRENVYSVTGWCVYLYLYQ